MKITVLSMQVIITMLKTGLYYLNSRFYDPETARFMQEDSYDGDVYDPLSLNLYTYCSNNPISYYDPTGHSLKSIAKAAKKVVKSAAAVVKTAVTATKAVVKETVKTVKTAVNVVKPVAIASDKGDYETVAYKLGKGTVTVAITGASYGLASSAAGALLPEGLNLGATLPSLSFDTLAVAGFDAVAIPSIEAVSVSVSVSSTAVATASGVAAAGVSAQAAVYNGKFENHSSENISSPDNSNTNIKTSDNAKYKSNRNKYMGRTPSKNSRTGREFLDRMKSEGKIRNGPNGQEFKASDGNWYTFDIADMSHKTDAVSWWNSEGRQYGAKSSEVRNFMLDSNNYELDLNTINRSHGPHNEKYQPPIKK